MHTYTSIYSQRTLTASPLTTLCRFISPLLVGALLASPLAAQVGLGLTPMRLEFPAVGGKAVSGALTLSNSSTKKVRVKTEILDFFVDNDQTPQFLPDVPSEADYSCRSWISVNPMEAEVDPKSQLSVRYTVRIPAEAPERSYHCAIGFVSMPTSEEAQGLGVRTAVRVVAALYPIVGHPVINGQISELALEPVVQGDKVHWRGVMFLENAGFMLYRPQGRVEVLNGAGKVVETLQLASFPVLPRRRQRFLLPLRGDLPAGDYTLRAQVDVGNEIQEASAKVSAVLSKQ